MSGRSVGRRSGAQVVQDDPCPAERHVPVVGLVQVVVQADDAAGLAGRPGCPGSSRGRPGTTSADTSRRSSRARRHGRRATTMTTSVDQIGCGRPSAMKVTPRSRSTWQWSPTMSRVAAGGELSGSPRRRARSASRRCRWHVRRCGCRRGRSSARVSESTISQSSLDRGERADVAVDDPRAGADDRRPSHDRVRRSPRPRFDHHSALDLGRLVDLAVIGGLEHLESSRLASRSGVSLPVSIHHPSRIS